MTDTSYYVYVYIDPRSLEEFYYGKGKGSRREAHLFDIAVSEKTARIAAIRAEGLHPIIRTVASGLTEEEAFLIESTLIWKLGRNLTNVASGRYSSKFRPHNTLHKNIAKFDFQNGIYFVNVGEGSHRNWDDCREYGFVSAGHNPTSSAQLRDLDVGDIGLAYFTRRGFVGVFRVLQPAVPFYDFRYHGRPLTALPLRAPNMADDANDPKLCEYVVAVEWIRDVPREEAKWQARSGLWAKQRVVASLADQPATIAFVGRAFGLELESFIQ